MLLARFIKHSCPIINSRVQCNVCNWKGYEFEGDKWHKQTICPACFSDVRHRLTIAAFQFLKKYSLTALFSKKNVLHFAAEPFIRRIIEPLAMSYRTADISNSKSDIRLDMCDMPSLASKSIDTLVACDVLEHVRDDIKAISEIHRVLTTGGMAILTVPQPDGWTHKLELPGDATPEERLEKVAQSDHQRMYGADFPFYLKNAGFYVDIVDASNFPRNIVKKHVLSPPVPSHHPLATNHRRIFFATKA